LKRPEQSLQRQVLEYLGYALPRHLVLHIPNGGARSKVEASILSGLGVRAGVPDLVIVGQGFAGFLELKAGKRNPSAAQVAFFAECDRLGIPCRIVRSIDEAEDALLSWGLEVRARVS
jgi:hypothetical protein